MGKPPEASIRSIHQSIWPARRRLETWSRAMTDLANAESPSEASTHALDSYLTITASAHKLFTQFMAQILGQLNMPTQSEITAWQNA